MPKLDAALRDELPRRFLGHETNFDAIWVATPADFLRGNLGIGGSELGAVDWLAIDDLRLHLMAVEWTRILYPPYAKWFGSAFKRLACSAGLQPPITRLLAAQGWEQRDVAWAELMRRLIALHEDAGLIEAGKYRVAPVYAVGSARDHG